MEYVIVVAIQAVSVFRSSDRESKPTVVHNVLVVFINLDTFSVSRLVLEKLAVEISAFSLI